MNAMTTIDRLIFDTLAARHSVTLPGEGTLEVRRRGARKISDTRIVPPQNVVVFLPGEQDGGRNIVALVADDRSVDMDEAAAIYGTWLEGARRYDGTLTIEEVGETVAEGPDGPDGSGPGGPGAFEVSDELHNALNPIEDEDFVTMETGKRSTPPWVWIVIAILAAALIAAGVLLCRRGGAVGGDRQIEVVVPATPVPEPEPAEDPLASVEAARAAAAAAEAEAAAAAARERFHVIAGAFSIESNADNFVARIKREHPELTPRKIVNPSNGLNMVSIIQTPTRREASNKMSLYWDIDLYLWIYEQ